MNKYQQQKARAIEQAKQWQNEFSQHDYSWGKLAQAQEHFGKLAKRYGLVKEFKENGII